MKAIPAAKAWKRFTIDNKSSKLSAASSANGTGGGKADASYETGSAMSDLPRSKASANDDEITRSQVKKLQYRNTVEDIAQEEK